MRSVQVAGGGDGGEALLLFSDTACSGQRGAGVRPDLLCEFDIVTATEEDDIGAVEQALVCGLVPELVRGDRSGLAEAQVVGLDDGVEVQESVAGGHDADGLGPGESGGGAESEAVVGASVELAGR